jgi:putative aldouronate transport system substrate-binding protein
MKYASAKQIIALDEYFDYAPNLTRLMSEDKSIYQNIVLPDGHVYSLPQLNETEANLINKYWLNMKWLKNLNLEVPETTEDFYNVLKAFVEKDPNGNGKADEIGYSGSFKENPLEIIRNFLGSWGFGKNAGIINGLMDVDDSGKIRLITIEPKYKEVIEFMNRMWKDGLIDKEIFSQQSAQVISKITADQVGFTNFGNNTLWMGVNSDNYDQPPVLKGPYGDSIWSNVNPKVQTTGTFVITGKNQYPEETMRWADYFYSKEGTILVRLGIEGKSFSIDKDGKYQLLDEIKNDPTGLGQDQAQAKWTLYCGGGIPQYAIDELDQSPAQLPAMKKTTETLRPDLIPLSSIPRLKFTEEESIRLGTYSQDIKTYITQNIVKFITGEQSMSKWDKYVSDLQKMDIEDYISIYQESYDRWKNTLN